MTSEVLLPYGDRPYRLAIGSDTSIAHAPEPGFAKPIRSLLERALDAPRGLPPIERLCPPRGNAVVIVSDDTRDDPRRELALAALSRLPESASIRIAIASGTHKPCDPSALGLGDDLLRRAAVIRHDARDDASLVSLGTTARGTPVRVNRCLLDADVVVATGMIKPHYFAGFGAGAKAVFPGLGGEREIRINHELKQHPGARPGSVDENPCRLDIEEAVDMLPTPVFLLNGIPDAHGGAQGAVAGDVREAFREGARQSANLFSVRAPKSALVVVSDALPVTGSLYQASKLVAAGAPLLEEEGTIALVAQCPQGTGPLQTVNRGIYEIGLRPRLPRAARVVLVSDLAPAVVRETYCEYAARASDVLESAAAAPTILPRAGTLIATPLESRS